MEIDRRIDELVAVLRRLGRRPRKFEVSFEAPPKQTCCPGLKILVEANLALQSPRF